MIDFSTTPQDVLRAIGLPEHAMTPDEWAETGGVQITKDAELILVVDVYLRTRLLRFRKTAQGWEKPR